MVVVESVHYFVEELVRGNARKAALHDDKSYTLTHAGHIILYPLILLKVDAFALCLTICARGLKYEEGKNT